MNKARIRAKIRVRIRARIWARFHPLRAFRFSLHFDHVICFFPYVNMEESRGERLQIAIV